MKPCPNIKENKQKCPCTSDYCQRHGRCCECIAYHKKQGELPACLR